MEYGLHESGRITKAFIEERDRLEEARRAYERTMEWREVFQFLMAFVLAAVVGVVFGWYYFGHPH